MLSRLLLAGMLGWSSCCMAFDLHVAKSGNDANPGTEAAPFATVERARDAVREVLASGTAASEGVRVCIHEGSYPLLKGLTLEKPDSGTEKAPVVYQAVPEASARFVGGHELPVAAFAKATKPEALARLDAAVRDTVMAVDLKALGITEYGAFPDGFEAPPAVPELFFNDERMTLACWPNEGWAEIAKVIESGPAPWRNHESDQFGVFEYQGDRPARWTGTPDVWLEGYWCFDWAVETVRVKGIDTQARTITLAKKHVYGIGSGNSAPRRFRAVNLLEELDRPGEYYLDRADGTLYFWPPKPLEGARIILSTLADPVVSIKGAGYVTLSGVIVETGAGTGIRVEAGEHVAIDRCVVRNVGQHGVVVTGGTFHRVTGCDIHDTGMAGLMIDGGDRKTLTPSHHEALNNDIHHVSRRMRTHANNVHINGVGVTLAHNAIHDAPHQGIGLGGNDHVIEFNDVYRIGMESDDCGAFYMGRNPSERGTILRHNFWHDIGSSMSHGSCAIYFDDGAGGQTVQGNVFYKACGGQFGAVFSHGGHDNAVVNNVFIDCKKAFSGVPWSAKSWREWLDGELWQTRLLHEVDITSPTYTDRYPQLAGFMDSDKRLRLNTAARNLVVHCAATVDGNWDVKDCVTVAADPGFADAAAQNFALREDAEVITRIPGFEPIPFSKIGLLKDQPRPEAAAK